MTDPKEPHDSIDPISSLPQSVAQEVEELERTSATATRLFDIRRIIGGLFLVYGIVVTILGIAPSDADLKKAQDININLWSGLVMIALGVLFLLWQHLRPLIPPTKEELAEAIAERPENP
jgi:hypothetical protein